MDDSAFKTLPLYDSLPEIRAELSKGKDLLLTAPTGSGKSTFIPWLLSTEKEGRAKVAVLEPRRLAVTSLSARLSKLLRVQEGSTVGYKVRFDSRSSAETQILFTTYGSFLQSALHRAETLDWIVFDEFHERRAEMDLLLAFFCARKRLFEKGGRPTPRIAVLSAELDREGIEAFLKIPCLKVGRPGFPVQILNQDSPAGTPLERNVERAVRTLERNGFGRTTLVFLPGKGEISKVHRHLDEAFGYGRIRILDLYGGQGKSVEQEIFTPSDERRVILSTNIAETSLTIPGVTGVVDSGLERSAEFDSGRGRNVLRLGRISLQNAVQRTGRAGRTREGACIRLWGKTEECHFPEGIVPEILKGDLRPILLERAALSKIAGIPPREMPLLTEPADAAAQKASDYLASNGFIDASDGKITPTGERVLDVPLNDLSLAKAYLEAPSLSNLTLALFAVLDAEDTTGRANLPQDALEAAEGLLARDSRAPRDTRLSFERLSKHARAEDAGKLAADSPAKTLKIFFDAFPKALAIQSGNSYKTAEDTFPISPKAAGDAPAILVFHLLRTNSAQKSEMRAGLYLKVPESLLQRESAKTRYELLWRSGQERYTGLEIREKDGVEISRKDVPPQEAAPEVLKILKSLTGRTWMERHRREDLSHLWMDDANKTLLCKMKLAAANFPEYSLPAWDDGDMELVTEDFMDGVFLLRELSAERFRKKMGEYFGTNMLPWLSKMFPDTLHLPNGKRAHYRYAEGSPVELSARIEDFLPFRGEHSIAEGRVKVRYDILAPNFRTCQKTWDLSGFWKNTYPQVRKELRGRYPKHPWPESV